MKKSLIVLLLIGLLLPMTMSAQSFDALWKQVEQARQKDLPKTQINLLDKIERKARREKIYGQLLAANTTASSEFFPKEKMMEKPIYIFARHLPIRLCWHARKRPTISRLSRWVRMTASSMATCCTLSVWQLVTTRS